MVFPTVCCRNYYAASFVLALLTIGESLLHTVLCVYGNCLSGGAVTPTHTDVALFYLTYLYNKQSKIVDLVLHTTSLFDDIDEKIIVQIFNMTGFFPEKVNAEPRMVTYILCYIIINTLWLVASVALLMAVCFKIKETGALLFYGPWILTTSLVVIMDLIATVHFGLDLPSTWTFDNWLKFIGIKDTDKFGFLNEENPSKNLSVVPTVIALLIASKGVIFWIINIIGIYVVTQTAILSYQQLYEEEEKFIRRKIIHETTQAARIRNWQLHYNQNHRNDEESIC